MKITAAPSGKSLDRESSEIESPRRWLLRHLGGVVDDHPGRKPWGPAALEHLDPLLKGRQQSSPTRTVLRDVGFYGVELSLDLFRG